MKYRTVAIFLFLLGSPYPALASEPFEFISDVIQSLGICRIADDHIKGSETHDIISTMKNIRVFSNSIQHADSIIQQHMESDNELIKESAANFSFIYSSIVKNNTQLLDFIEETLNKPDDALFPQGTWMRRLSEYMATNEELWRTLVYATVMSTYTMVDMSRSEESNAGFLTIAAAERDMLKAELRKVFGDEVTGGMKAGQAPIDASGAVLWEFLAKAWKPADAS